MMKSLQHLLLLLLLFLTLLPSNVLSSNNNDLSSSEATRYSTLPPTVFSPTGRLFGVERVARESMLLPPSSTSAMDESCTVLAIRCGPRCVESSKSCRSECSEDKVERGELTIMMGIGPMSPSLHRDVELYHHQQQMDSDINDNEQQLSSNTTNITTIPSFYKPLQLHQQSASPSSSSLPISILSPTLVTATGGLSIDSSILLRRSIEVALSLYKLDNGGIDLFASSSLEGPAVMKSRRMMGDSTSFTSDDDGSDNDGDVIQQMSVREDFGGISIGGGGASNVKIEVLVRRIANMAQSSTQNLGGKYGRMLSSSLLAMGVQQPSQQQAQQSTDDDKEQPDNYGGGSDKLCIWRVDPTGQFWKCDASAVGRGTVEVEEELLSRVRQWKKRMIKESEEKDGDGKMPTTSVTDSDDDELNQVRISNNDVRSYLSSLTEVEAVQVASDCLVNGILNCKGTATTLTTTTRNNERGGNGASSLRDWMEYDLRRRMQCVILRSTSCGGMHTKYEIVRRL